MGAQLLYGDALQALLARSDPPCAARLASASAPFCALASARAPAFLPQVASREFPFSFVPKSALTSLQSYHFFSSNPPNSTRLSQGELPSTGRVRHSAASFGDCAIALAGCTIPARGANQGSAVLLNDVTLIPCPFSVRALNSRMLLHHGLQISPRCDHLSAALNDRQALVMGGLLSLTTTSLSEEVLLLSIDPPSDNCSWSLIGDRCPDTRGARLVILPNQQACILTPTLQWHVFDMRTQNNTWRPTQDLASSFDAPCPAAGSVLGLFSCRTRNDESTSGCRLLAFIEATNSGNVDVITFEVDALVRVCSASLVHSSIAEPQAIYQCGRFVFACRERTSAEEDDIVRSYVHTFGEGWRFQRSERTPDICGLHYDAESVPCSSGTQGCISLFGRSSLGQLERGLTYVSTTKDE